MKRGEPTILVVDDDPRNVKLLDAMLRAEGYRTVSAGSGPEGRKVAGEVHPDLIMLDIMMPGETGLETCFRLKQDPLLADIPVIFISALDDTESKVEGLTLGAVDYITKPFQRLEVLARTRNHLKLGFAYRAVIESQAEKLRQVQNAQQSILIRPDQLPDANFGIYYRPLLEAGGDFYDVMPVGNGIHAYIVADVSGHDLGASYVTSALKALVIQNVTPLNTPVETVKIMNGVLKSILPEGKYLTACYLVVNRIHRRITVIGAGHPPTAVLYSDGQFEWLECKGDVIGAFENAVFEPIQKKVAKGDRIFLYSDGLVDNIGGGGAKLEQRMDVFREACLGTKAEPIDLAVGMMAEAMVPPDMEMTDDIVIMGIEV